MKPRGQITSQTQIRKDLAAAMLKGIRNAVLGNKTDQEIFEADQKKPEWYRGALQRL